MGIPHREHSGSQRIGAWPTPFLYDLGEFDQKGSVRTKYGTREEYLAAIRALQAQGLQAYADVVLNHKGGADGTERVRAVRLARDDRDRELGRDLEIDAWTRFDFPGRGSAHSDFKWRWFRFDGVDWAQNLRESSIFKFRGAGKAWDWQVDPENRNYDYLMFADLDLDHPEVVAELERWGEWYLAETGVDGFRLDAVKHIRFGFFPDWLGHDCAPVRLRSHRAAIDRLLEGRRRYAWGRPDRRSG